MDSASLPILVALRWKAADNVSDKINIWDSRAEAIAEEGKLAKHCECYPRRPGTWHKGAIGSWKESGNYESLHRSHRYRIQLSKLVGLRILPQSFLSWFESLQLFWSAVFVIVCASVFCVLLLFYIKSDDRWETKTAFDKNSDIFAKNKRQSI